MKKWLSISLIPALALGLLACSNSSGEDGGGPFVEKQNPKIQVLHSGGQLRNGDTLQINAGTVAVGEDRVVAELQIYNIGERTLTIDHIEISSEPAGVFDLVPEEGGELPGVGPAVEVEPGIAESGRKSYFLDLHFKRPEDSDSVGGTITIRSDSFLPDTDVMVFDIASSDLKPQIQVTPSVADFGNVGQGVTDVEDLLIFNSGTDTLLVQSFRLTEPTAAGDPSFSFAVGEEVWKTSAETAMGIAFETPISIPPGSSTSVSVNFEPTGPQAATGELRLYSNDPTKVDGAVVSLQGNVGGPCIAVNPKTVNFGGKLIGKMASIDVEVKSCGTGDLKISGISLLEGSSLDYSLDLGGLPGVEAGTTELAAGETTITLGVNESATFQVRYIPDGVNPVDEDGLPIPDLGSIEIVTNTFFEDLVVDVEGFGVLVECPTAVIKVQEGEEVIPQTKLHLSGSQSYAASGPIAKHQWTVEQPPGSQSVFLPSAAAPDPTFEANVAGTYTFKLDVWDTDDVQSCVPAEYTVIVRPDEAIHIELLWTTPGDPDETDEGPEAGADLDLHFKHPFATGMDVDGDGKPDGWFDNPFDCFWFNPAPDWGSLDPFVDDDPGLDRDDTDGAGPENVNLNIPEDGLTYTVGVHYWNDHGWGKSFATVRVYIHSVLVKEFTGVELVNHDLWPVCEISWPSGQVTAITDEGGEPKIIHNYEHPLFGAE